MKEIELYLDFLEMEYDYNKEMLKQIKEKILNNFNKEHGLLYITSRNDTKEFQLNINFEKRKLKWYIDNKLIQELEFTKEEFLNYLANLDYQYLYSYFSDYED